MPFYLCTYFINNFVGFAINFFANHLARVSNALIAKIHDVMTDRYKLCSKTKNTWSLLNYFLVTTGLNEQKNIYPKIKYCSFLFDTLLFIRYNAENFTQKGKYIVMRENANRLKKLNTWTEKIASQRGNGIVFRDTVSILAETNTYPKSHRIYPAAITLMAHGNKTCYVGEQVFNYAAGDLCVTMLPIPVETELLNASEENPAVSVAVGIDFSRMANMLIKIESVDASAFQPVELNASSIFSSTANANIMDAFIHLLEVLENDRDAAVLSDAIIDEIYYRILVDERNGELRYLLQQRGEIQRIAKAVKYIHKNLQEPILVDELTMLVHMSRSAFFDKFKEVMHTTPLQYAKSIKLHRAQAFIQQGVKAGDAARLVGYKSSTQFSREYKRHFGFVPSETITI